MQFMIMVLQLFPFLDSITNLGDVPATDGMELGSGLRTSARSR
jgi:hypothetical protein